MLDLLQLDIIFLAKCSLSIVSYVGIGDILISINVGLFPVISLSSTNTYILYLMFMLPITLSVSVFNDMP